MRGVLYEDDNLKSIPGVITNLKTHKWTKEDSMKMIFSNSTMRGVIPWAKTEGEGILAKKFGVALISQTFINPETQGAEEYIFCRKVPGVTIVPVLANGNLVVTRQFKQGLNTVIWEFPAGRKPKNISTTNQAKAELSEESGLIAGKMIHLGRACVAPRKLDSYEDLFVALDCEVSKPSPLPGEILDVYEMTPEELWKIIKLYDGSFSGFSEMAAMRAAEEGFLKRL